MQVNFRNVLSFAGIVALAHLAVGTITTPHVRVPSCQHSQAAHLSYSKALPDLSPFPLTHIDLCYSEKFVEFTLTAYNETSFYYNASQGTNDLIFEYEVMEIFMAKESEVPITYFEFEVNPNNVTLQTFVFNPSGRRLPETPFDHFVVLDPFTDGIAAKTVLDRPGQVWTSQVKIPLGFFNVYDGKAKGTKWRMNFFRTVTNSTMFPKQLMGAWSPPDVADFHVTPYFGHFTFE